MSNKELVQQRIADGIKLVEDEGVYDVNDYTKTKLLAVAYAVHCGGKDNSIVDIDPVVYSETSMLILASQNHNHIIGTVSLDELELLINQYPEYIDFVVSLLVVSRNPDSGYSEMQVLESDPLPINVVLASTLTDDTLATEALTMYPESIAMVIHDLSEYIYGSGIAYFMGLIGDEETESIDFDTVDSEETEAVELDTVDSDDSDVPESTKVAGYDPENHPRYAELRNYIINNGTHDIVNYTPPQLEYLAVCMVLGYDLERILELDPINTSIVNMIYYTACINSGDLVYNPLPDYISTSIEMQLLVITLSDDPRGSQVREMLDNGVATDIIATTLAADSIMLSRITSRYPDTIFYILAATLELPPEHPLSVLVDAVNELEEPEPNALDKDSVDSTEEDQSCDCGMNIER